MRQAVRFLALALVLGATGWSQEAQEPAPPPQPAERPTLRPGPSGKGGPRTATTNNPRKLLRIRTLFVDRIDNSLSDRLLEDLTKVGRFRIVEKAKDADAVLRGSCLESRRLKRVHSEVFIADRNGDSIWQDDLYRPYNPPSLQQAVEETATLVVDHLSASIQEAENR